MKNTRIAVRLAITHHKDQMYGDLPYLSHLQEVADSVKEAGGGDLEIATAWLHDILEDTKCTAQIMWCDGIESTVIDAVLCLTKKDGETYEDYIRKVKSNKIALFVKKHDTLLNLTNSLREKNHKRVIKYSKQLTLLEEV